jgi:hypothetical protein
MARSRRREVAPELARREGTRGAKVRGGGERRAQCREVEARASFIGWESERGSQEEGGQAVVGGASSKYRLWKRRRGCSHLMNGK